MNISDRYKTMTVNRPAHQSAQAAHQAVSLLVWP